MAAFAFERSVQVAASPSAVYAELSEPRRFLGLQPLLVELRDTGRGVDALGRPVLHFETVERLVLLGVLPLRNRIRGTLTRVDDGSRIEVAVWSRPGIRLQSFYDVRAEGDGARVCETVLVDCPKIVARLVRREAVRAHERLLAALKERLESTA